MTNSFSKLSDYDVSKALSEEGLTKADFEEICNRLDRPPNRTELGMFGVMWSEHCCYRNSRPLLKLFPTKGPRILVGPGENAGVLDLGENQKLVFKIESHNHPSAVEPFQGAATGVGGILRDIFTMGARPIALLNALRFGPLEETKNISLMQGVVSGIAHYGNCVGVPTIGGEVVFDKSYSGNPLVNAMALGLLETKDIVCSGAEGVGFPVMYVGSTTGRDGMGGASFASAELTDSSIDDRPAVQVGDPFLEKGLIEACLEAFKSGDVIAAQDMGAAGLTCSCAEMAAKGGLGIELDLDLVPARETGMTAYEFLLSESQERMLFVVKPESVDFLINKFTKWGLQAKVVGRVLEEKVVRVLHNSKISAEIPSNALADDTPINNHELLNKPPEQILSHWNWNENTLPSVYVNGIAESLNNQFHKPLSWNQVLLELLDNPSIASKRWIYQQYDYQVQSNTIIPPGIADAAVVRLRPQLNTKPSVPINRGIAAVVDCPNRWSYLDPERGGMYAVIEAARNISCVGAEPLAITDNLNFPSPETPFGYWQLAMSCRGISTACKAFNTPITGGNVSLYNEIRLENGKLQPIHPTPVIGMVGLINNLDLLCDQSWKNDNDSIWMIGIPIETSMPLDSRITLGGSTFLEHIHGLISGRPPTIDLQLELSIQSFLRESIMNGYLSSAHDISDGGLAVCLAECCISSGLGAHIELPSSEIRLDRLLFAEGGARILVSVANEKIIDWKALLNSTNKNNPKPVEVSYLGKVKKDSGLIVSQINQRLIDLSVSVLKETFEFAIPRRIIS